LEIVCDIATESLIVGSFYKKPSLFFEYDDLIFQKWDFTNDDLRFLYNLIRTCYYREYKYIDETVINIEVNKNPEWKKRYEKIYGYKTIDRLINKVNLDHFPKYFKDLKKYNLLRELQRDGFPVEQKLNEFKDKEAEEIYRYFDYNLAKIYTHYHGTEDSIILGEDMPDVFEQWMVEPDIGMEIPYNIVNDLIRGWRIGKLNAIGMHSGVGKSRYICSIVVHFGITLGLPILVIVNEQDKTEWDAMLLTSVVNNIFLSKTKHIIDETKIVTGNLTEDEMKICREAAKYIKEKSKIYFQETQVFDFYSLRRILKVHKLKGVDYFVYDTFKPFRDMKGATWEAFVQTSEMLKQLCGNAKKGGLDLGGWITFQLTDDTLFEKVLTSMSIASGKHIKHNFDFLMLSREIRNKEKDTLKVKIHQRDSIFNGDIQELDLFKRYYITFVDKNRGGKDHDRIISEVDKGGIVFKELGFAYTEDKKQDVKNKANK